MLFMVIERYKNGDADAVYRRFREHGRMMPAGLEYIDSWVEQNYERCFQLMAADDPGLFDQWISHWSDLVDFEIVPIVNSSEVREQIGKCI